MRVLVTGGTGLVGKNLKEICPSPTFIYLSSKDCNLLDYQDTKITFEYYNPTHVIHLAAKVGGLYMNLEYNFEMLHDNLLINMNIMKVCKERKIKNFIGCLSTCIFPDKVKYPITEEQLHNGEPHTSNEGYAYGKRMLDVFCRQMNKIHGYTYRCIIPTNIYGKFDNFHLKHSHVIPGLIHKCYLAKKNNEPFKVMGTGKALRQFIYVGDLALIIKHLVYSYNGKEINIICSVSEDEEISIRSIVEKIAKIMQYDNIEYDTSFRDGQYKKTVSNEKLKKIIPSLKFKTIDYGLRTTIKWFCENFDTVRK